MAETSCLSFNGSPVGRGAWPSWWEQVGEHCLADAADEIGVVCHVDGVDQQVFGGFEGGGEAGPVRVGAGAGFDGGDHGSAQRLVDGEQGPQFLFEPGRIGRAQHAVFGEGVVQRQVGDLVFPAFVVDGDEPERGIVARVQQGGG